MIILRPDWVSHTDDKKKNATIFTLHLHPNGKKLATGSLMLKLKFGIQDRYSILKMK